MFHPQVKAWGFHTERLVKDEHTAQIEQAPGTGMKRDKTAQEIRDAQPGIGHWMLHDQYNVDGALLFLEEYFVNASL